MSHIVTLQSEITDLATLTRAAANLGLELRHGQTTYRWYGRLVGDAERALPAGFTSADIGLCQHAICVPDTSPNHRPGTTYEIGVVARRDGRPGYALLFDEWNAGYGLLAHAGPHCRSLVHEYAALRAADQARRMGWAVQQSRNQDGSIAQLTMLR